MDLSIVLPAKNEEQSLDALLPTLQSSYPDAQIIVVDDGSTDGTSDVARKHEVELLANPYSMGNGAAIKRGARAATGRCIVFMDADGQHDPDSIKALLAKIDQGFDMAVGERDRDGQASFARYAANTCYNLLASTITGQRIPDLTSGLRAVNAEKFKEFLHLLPNGFSYPTTITMAFFRSAYSVAYVPVAVGSRTGKSHVKPVQDGVRFLLIIFKIATLYSPLKLFAPVSLSFFVFGLAYYAYTFTVHGRFTNMSVLLFSAAVIVFLIGLVSEQITSLSYRKTL